MKGPSWLCTIPQFNIINGMSVDYMHCVLLGVSRLLLQLWFDTHHHKEVWYLGGQRAVVDSRLCKIKPPSEIQRTPRSIQTTVKFWKGYYIYILTGGSSIFKGPRGPMTGSALDYCSSVNLLHTCFFP